MNREFARIITCLLDEKLRLPSMILESIEENLVKGNFDKVYEYYKKRMFELHKEKEREEAKKQLEKELGGRIIHYIKEGEIQ